MLFTQGCLMDMRMTAPQLVYLPAQNRRHGQHLEL